MIFSVFSQANTIASSASAVEEKIDFPELEHEEEECGGERVSLRGIKSNQIDAVSIEVIGEEEVIGKDVTRQVAEDQLMRVREEVGEDMGMSEKAEGISAAEIGENAQEISEAAVIEGGNIDEKGKNIEGSPLSSQKVVVEREVGPHDLLRMIDQEADEGAGKTSSTLPPDSSPSPGELRESPGELSESPGELSESPGELRETPTWSLLNEALRVAESVISLSDSHMSPYGRHPTQDRLENMCRLRRARLLSDAWSRLKLWRRARYINAGWKRFERGALKEASFHYLEVQRDPAWRFWREWCIVNRLMVIQRKIHLPVRISLWRLVSGLPRALRYLHHRLQEEALHLWSHALLEGRVDAMACAEASDVHMTRSILRAYSFWRSLAIEARRNKLTPYQVEEIVRQSARAASHRVLEYFDHLLFWHLATKMEASAHIWWEKVRSFFFIKAWRGLSIESKFRRESMARMVLRGNLSLMKKAICYLKVYSEITSVLHRAGEAP